MNKHFCSISLTLIFITLMSWCYETDLPAQNKTDFTPYYKYRVTLKDKKGSGYSLKHPEQFLSQRALERRKHQKIKVNTTDLPVSDVYVEGVTSKGVKLVHKSKWNNTIVVSTVDTAVMQSVAELPYVTSVRKVATYLAPSPVTMLDTIDRHSLIKEDHDTIEYKDIHGDAYCQIHQLNGEPLHQAGYRGEGMVIAVIDGGFTNADIIPRLKNTKILGTKDFVGYKQEFYATQSHGMMVLSCMGTNVPYDMVGTAPEASYWLLMSEDGGSEQLVEEDNWCAAIEFADSVGADVVNTSLGYANFDNPDDCLKYWFLDGKTELISRSASMCASKGMILVNSAGNSADEPWKLITPPADAKDVLTVGAVTSKGRNTNFSSLGNTADGRIKPDVVAMGQDCTVLNINGTRRQGNGTSFASPILCGMVACLWQALPELNAYQIMDLVRRSGNNATHPDNVYGYGIPNFNSAWKNGASF